MTKKTYRYLLRIAEGEPGTCYLFPEKVALEEGHCAAAVVGAARLTSEAVPFHWVEHHLEFLSQFNELLDEPRSILELDILIDQAVKDQKRIFKSGSVVDGARNLVGFRIFIGQV